MIKTNFNLTANDIDHILEGESVEFEIFDSSGAVRKIDVRASLAAQDLEKLIAKLILRGGGSLIKENAENYINEVKNNGG